MEMCVERKQIHVEKMQFATRPMQVLYASASLALRGTWKQASVKVWSILPTFFIPLFKALMIQQFVLQWFYKHE